MELYKKLSVKELINERLELRRKRAKYTFLLSQLNKELKEREEHLLGELEQARYDRENSDLGYNQVLLNIH